ncbi:hypothetical protein [Janthinobacterium sp. HLS12-2]|uniref:hypothetical protein n=1 Tax=Janthinobacterium sp. HLS12-2 TaxID=1259324 RepID=UPI003F1FAE03
MTQLALFEVERRDGRIVRWEAAFSSVVEAAVMAAFEDRPNEWLRFSDCRKITEKYQISFCFGHVLGQLSRRGKINAKNIYCGSDHPGKANYLGFNTVYMLEKGSAS